MTEPSGTAAYPNAGEPSGFAPLAGSVGSSAAPQWGPPPSMAVRTGFSPDGFHARSFAPDGFYVTGQSTNPWAGPPRRSALATASLVLGLIGLVTCFFVVPSLVAVGLGVAALVATGRAKGRLAGTGLAWAGLATGALGVAAGVWFIVAVVASEEFQEGLEQGLGSGYEDIEVGECILIPDSEVVIGFVERPCEQPHGGEVYLVGNLPPGPFPGNQEAISEVQDRCLNAFNAYVGISYDESAYDMWSVSPQKSNWARGERDYLCAVTTVDGSDLPPGSVRGLAI